MESVFEVIAEPNRRAILRLLVSSQQSVGDIERRLRIPQPAVSKHLRVLREAGFVESTVDAQRRLYRLKPERLQEVDDWLAQFRRFWSAHVDALERHLDRMDRANPPLCASGKSRNRLLSRKPRAVSPMPDWSRHMKTSAPMESASTLLDKKIKELGDWRGKTLAKVRQIVHDADPDIVEEWKWVKPTNPGTPVWSHGGIVCTGETYKNAVKMTFAKGAALKDPSHLFNSSLDGNVRRAIDIHEGDTIDEAALKDLIRAAVALNLQGKSKPKRATSKRAG